MTQRIASYIFGGLELCVALIAIALIALGGGAVAFLAGSGCVAAFFAGQIFEEGRAASAMSAFGQDAEERLEAKPASATAQPGRPMNAAQLARDSAE